MKLVNYERTSGEIRVGLVENGNVLEAGTSLFQPVSGEVVGRLNELSLRAPLISPQKVVCVGLNYRDHADEAGQPIPEVPILFAKFANSIIGHGESIVIPSIAKEVDYEAELGVVMGKRASGLSEEEAPDYILGYTCLNDVSARDLQFVDSQWTRGKTLDTFCPIGPWIVTSDEIPDPQTLGIRCVVNGQTLQDSSTKEMIRSVPELISFISQTITLEPGDLIATGTPAGVGFTRKPPIYLRPGDTVRVEIDKIGELENPVTERAY